MVQINIDSKKGLVQKVGNNGVTAETTVRMRSGATAGGAPSHTCAWQAHAEVGSGNVTITAAQVLTGILADDPEGNANWTLPTAALLVAALPGAAIGDCIDFSVINEATTTVDEKVTIVMGTSGTAVGLMVVDSQLVSGIRGTGSGWFRIRLTGVASGSEAYTCYRLA